MPIGDALLIIGLVLLIARLKNKGRRDMAKMKKNEKAYKEWKSRTPWGMRENERKMERENRNRNDKW